MTPSICHITTNLDFNLFKLYTVKWLEFYNSTGYNFATELARIFFISKKKTYMYFILVTILLKYGIFYGI